MAIDILGIGTKRGRMEQRHFCGINHGGYVSALKGRLLEFRRYHNFVNLFSQLSESTFFTKK